MCYARNAKDPDTTINRQLLVQYHHISETTSGVTFVTLYSRAIMVAQISSRTLFQDLFTSNSAS